MRKGGGALWEVGRKSPPRRPAFALQTFGARMRNAKTPGDAKIASWRRRFRPRPDDDRAEPCCPTLWVGQRRGETPMLFGAPRRAPPSHGIATAHDRPHDD